MKEWNVLVAVVQLVDAETEAEAIRIVEQQVQAAVDSFADVYPYGSNAFESEK